MLTKPNILRLVAYVVFFAAALYFPARTVLRFERPAAPPVEMRFRISAYDPYDPMRGRYLHLDVVCPVKSDLQVNGYSGYRAAVFEKDEAGFAVVSALLEKGDRRPAGKPFVRSRYFTIGNYSFGSGRDFRGVRMPFDRFYLNEPLAKPAEKLLREVAGDPKRSAVLVVDIHRDGTWAVKELLIDGKPIREAVRAAK